MKPTLAFTVKILLLGRSAFQARCASEQVACEQFVHDWHVAYHPLLLPHRIGTTVHSFKPLLHRSVVFKAKS